MPIGPITPGSPVVVTPDASPLTRLASMLAPTATMGITAAHIQALTLALLNLQEFYGHGDINDMKNATNVEERSMFFVFGRGWYYATYIFGGTADDKTIVDSVASPGAKWFWEGISWSSGTPRLAFVGPVPGVSTPAGRIDPEIQNYRTVFQNIHTPGTSSNTRPFTDPMAPFGADNLTGDALDAVQVGDVIRGSLSIAVNCASNFRIGVYVTQDGASTFSLVTPRISATLPVSVMPNAVAGDRVYCDMSFVHLVTASPTPSFGGWFLAGQGGGNLLTVNVGSAIVEVIRP